MGNSEILKKLESIKDLPTLPVIAFEINALLQADNTSVGMVAKCIEKDQAIASKVLKLINSAFFGVRSQVTNIQDAIGLLGFNSIRNIVLSVSVMKAFSNGSDETTFNISELWRHSIAVAVTSKYLSEKSNLSNPEDAFTGGLLHDIGKIIMAQYFTECFIGTIKDIEHYSLSFSQAEKKYMQKMGHARIGAFLTKKWKFPKSLALAIQNHHSINENFSELQTLVHIADIIVNIQRLNAMSLPLEEKKAKIPIVNKKAAQQMSEYMSTSVVWYPELVVSIEEACSFFIDDSV